MRHFNRGNSCFALLSWIGYVLLPICSVAYVHAREVETAVVQQPGGVQIAGNSDNWSYYGRTQDEQRYSPLSDINTSNVKDLGLAWSADIDSPDGLSATPLAIDGTVYLSGGLGLVVALDAQTGKQRWSFRPEGLNLTTIFSSWTSRFNRGVAFKDGKVFVATGDCRLFALDAHNGHEIWERQNCDIAKGYGSTGAPRIVKDMVVIGNSGADVGSRGYVSAYDVNTGTLRWRFYTVPGDPALGFEQAVLKKAAATWSGREWWKSGGGSAWEAIVYDADLNRIYFGTDGAWPWDAKVGWGKKLGDRLFTNSIVAVDADTGEYRWHYQETPGDVWDYNSTAQIMLATLRIGGKNRRVILHAPKNGFFYVLDRQRGKLLSADKFVTVTWASAIDLASGRPKEAPEARYYLRPNHWVTVYPYADGAHNWQGMSFNPKTGLVYIPATDASMNFRLGTGGGLGATEFQFDIPQESDKSRPLGRLIAWDPVAKAPRWTIELPYAINGGTLTTAGSLVFQGTAEGIFNAWNASDGHKMWSTSIVSATQAAPVTYRYEGKQYVLLAVGASGVSRAYIPEYGDPQSARGPSRLLAFALGGKETLPSGLLAQPQLPIPPRQFASSDTIERGRRLYYQSDCFICHGVRLEVAEGGSFRDLRYIPTAVHDQWNRIVLDGQLQAAGMPSFKGALSADDAQAIRAFVIAGAQKLYEAKGVLRGH